MNPERIAQEYAVTENCTLKLAHLCQNCDILQHIKETVQTLYLRYVSTQAVIWHRRMTSEEDIPVPWIRWFRRSSSGDKSRSKTNSDAVIEGLPVALVGGRHRTRGIPYVMPRDLEETNRLDFQHYLLRHALQRNFVTPIGENPQSILDVGTGTGRWAREMAQQFPLANVVGMDVNPPPVDQAAEADQSGDLRPPNYTFVPGNILERLPFPDGSFDFVHMRLLVSAIPHERWSGVVSELVRVTRIGGWVESVETILMERGGPALETIEAWGRPVMDRLGIQMADGGLVGQWMENAGLTGVVTHRIELPCGEWGGRVGRMVARDYLSGMKAFAGLLVSQQIATQADVDQVLAQASQELAHPRGHCVAPIFIAYGRRAR